jgi:excisionase family DNA binding protein
LTGRAETEHSTGGRPRAPATTKETPVSEVQRLTRRWYTVTEVAEVLGFGETKVRMAIISGDLRSVKDGKLRRILPEWVDEYVALKVAQSENDL